MSRDAAHRDLKLENALIDNGGEEQENGGGGGEEEEEQKLRG